MTAPHSGASRASPTSDWLTPDYVSRILEPITFPGDSRPSAEPAPDTTQPEIAS
ncbi:hypothetical protein AcetOrient_orf00251p (plasmid) [Acetobacter orientalis]|uniref:Uncharacterized protein n=1 Tax=Acetobacter orientalis TaxID=146474 RepID=A0A2Z5ZMM5_9PROT|nr:hypothetical protein [Acetobacter orientalis]BBC81870.1 hypothetical protein AcetOrient_orf00251p [Acetobacter orientalis]